MVVLGLDTATRTLVLGIADHQRILAECGLAASGATTRELFSGIDRVLADAGIDRSELQGVAVGVGPGSFTGVRVGLSAAQGIAAGLGVPVTGVDTLACVALNAPPEARRIAVLVDAGRSEVFLGLFERDGILLRSVAEPRATSPADAARAIASDSVVLGDGLSRYRDLVIGNLPPRVVALADDLASPRGGAVARMGAAALDGSDGASSSRLQPVYVREPDARTLAARALEASRKTVPA